MQDGIWGYKHSGTEHVLMLQCQKAALLGAVGECGVRQVRCSGLRESWVQPWARSWVGGSAGNSHRARRATKQLRRKA